MNSIQERQVKLALEWIGILIVYIVICVLVCTNFFKGNKKRERVLVDDVATSGDFFSELYVLELGLEEGTVSAVEYNEQIKELYERYNIEEEPTYAPVPDYIEYGAGHDTSGDLIRNSDTGASSEQPKDDSGDARVILKSGDAISGDL